MLTFSNWISDDEKLLVRGNPNLKSTMGLAMLSLIIFCILINLSVMGRAILQEAKAKWKTRQTVNLRLRNIELNA
jgi:hypothetical protein